MLRSITSKCLNSILVPLLSPISEEDDSLLVDVSIVELETLVYSRQAAVK